MDLRGRPLEMRPVYGGNGRGYEREGVQRRDNMLLDSAHDEGQEKEKRNERANSALQPRRRWP